MKIIKLLTLIVVLAFLYACGTSNDTVNVPGPGSGDTPPSYSGDVPPTDLLAGTSTFVVNGGEATTSGNGGNGGGFRIDSVGDVWITTSGSVDTSFTVETVTPAYGGNKLIIGSNTTATSETVSPCAGAAGPVYVYTGSTNLYYCDAISGQMLASGLDVQEGYTLTLPTNDGGSAHITLTGAVTINGTVTTPDGVSLDIRSTDETDGLIQIGANGLVTTKPLTAGSAGANITLYSSGVTINRGTIDASGSNATAAATAGGTAGSITFTGATGVYNTGSIDAKGGASAEEAGGNGGEISIYASAGTVYNSGTIDNSGGNGATTGGGTNSSIKLQGGSGYDAGAGTYITGSVIAGGFLTSNSGNAGTGAGGDTSGQGIGLKSYGGKIWSNATISAQGGSSDAGQGGRGNTLILQGEGGHYGINDVQTQGIQVGGTINLSGGYGATGGGDGGGLVISTYDDSDMVGLLGVSLPLPTVWMKGFDNFTINGGVGATKGGMGGMVYIETYPQWTANSVPGGSKVSVGAIFNQVPVYAKGGTSTTGEGGAGYLLFFMQHADPDLAVPVTTIISNSGAIDVSGGAGDVGGNSGFIFMVGTGLLENSGVITGTGGAGTTTGGNGAYTAEIEAGIWLSSLNTINNSGAIDVSGGAGATTGGTGGGIMADAGYHIWNSAALTATGGAGITTGGTGGDGGVISLFSGILQPTSNSGTLSVTGGAPAGNDGSISID